MEDLEEDSQIRSNVNIYRRGDRLYSVSSTAPSEMDESPRIELEEMLQDLNVDDPPDSSSEVNSGDVHDSISNK